MNLHSIALTAEQIQIILQCLENTLKNTNLSGAGQIVDTAREIQRQIAAQSAPAPAPTQT
jgi:hypothetical protein